MAVLTSEQLATLRQRIPAGNWAKPTINAAFQAIEDFFENNRATISTAIDTATAPHVFTAAQKRRLVALWLLQKFAREGIS